MSARNSAFIASMRRRRSGVKSLVRLLNGWCPLIVSASRCEVLPSIYRRCRRLVSERDAPEGVPLFEAAGQGYLLLAHDFAEAHFGGVVALAAGGGDEGVEAPEFVVVEPVGGLSLVFDEERGGEKAVGEPVVNDGLGGGVNEADEVLEVGVVEDYPAGAEFVVGYLEARARGSAAEVEQGSEFGVEVVEVG